MRLKIFEAIFCGMKNGSHNMGEVFKKIFTGGSVFNWKSELLQVVV